MQDNAHEFSKAGLFRQFIVPALWLFPIPAIGLFFFQRAEATFDADVRENFIQQINADPRLTAEEKAESVRGVREVRFSEMLMDPEFVEAVEIDPELQRDYATFRWMIRISITCLVSTVGVFVFGGICVLLSLKSQQAQYLSLSIGWHVLRLVSVVQIVGQGAVLVALSFWVTALLAHSYYPKLIGVAAIFAIVAIGFMIKGIFKRPKVDFSVEGRLIERSAAQVLWEDLDSICRDVGTSPPDQLIAGIDDRFFVTEHPVTVGGKVFRGRTLFVSLSLLRHLDGTEADAIMAHEMAHFSGNDTTYSRKISPLLVKYGNYLSALFEGGITRPVFDLMWCFRLLFEYSLSRLSRERELRADRIASEVTSPRDVVAGLLKTIAFSKYRSTIEQKLFEHEETLESANIFSQVEEGFEEFVSTFAAEEQNIGEMETVHPFDSHPSVAQRVSALDLELTPELTADFLTSESNGWWHQSIVDADTLEREQWTEFEQMFRAVHEQSLPYRYLPSTERERQLVVQYFPPVTIEGRRGTLEIDCESVRDHSWGEAVPWSDVKSCQMNEAKLEVYTISRGLLTINLKHYKKDAPKLMENFERQYGRYMTAAAYVAQQASESNGESGAGASGLE